LPFIQKIKDFLLVGQEKMGYFNCVVCERVVIGKFYVKLDIQIALLKGTLVNGHALVGYGSYAARCENLARRMVEDERSAVQLFDDHLEAAQGLGDVERVRHEEIIVIATKHVVLFQL
jgi:hypothetical protein